MKKIFILFIVLFPLLEISAEAIEAGVKNMQAGLIPYTVQRNDTLWQIAERRERVVEFIGKFNRLAPEDLQAGSVIMIPNGTYNISKLQNYSPLSRKLFEFKGETKAIYIDLSLEALGIYENGMLKKWFPISAGIKDFPTTTGNFYIKEKDVDHISKSYPKPDGGAKMPYSLRFFGRHYIHEGKMPGKPSSHGCVHLRRKDAIDLYFWAEIGTPIKIVE